MFMFVIFMFMRRSRNYRES